MPSKKFQVKVVCDISGWYEWQDVHLCATCSHFVWKDVSKLELPDDDRWSIGGQRHTLEVYESFLPKLNAMLLEACRGKLMDKHVTELTLSECYYVGPVP